MWTWTWGRGRWGKGSGRGRRARGRTRAAVDAAGADPSRVTPLPRLRGVGGVLQCRITLSSWTSFVRGFALIRRPAGPGLETGTRECLRECPVAGAERQRRNSVSDPAHHRSSSLPPNPDNFTRLRTPAHDRHVGVLSRTFPRPKPRRPQAQPAPDEAQKSRGQSQWAPWTSHVRSGVWQRCSVVRIAAGAAHCRRESLNSSAEFQRKVNYDPKIHFVPELLLAGEQFRNFSAVQRVLWIGLRLLRRVLKCRRR